MGTVTFWKYGTVRLVPLQPTLTHTFYSDVGADAHLNIPASDMNFDFGEGTPTQIDIVPPIKGNDPPLCASQTEPQELKRKVTCIAVTPRQV
jgi:hypothetical protein